MNPPSRELSVRLPGPPPPPHTHTHTRTHTPHPTLCCCCRRLHSGASPHPAGADAAGRPAAPPRQRGPALVLPVPAHRGAALRAPGRPRGPPRLPHALQGPRVCTADASRIARGCSRAGGSAGIERCRGVPRCRERRPASISADCLTALPCPRCCAHLLACVGAVDQQRAGAHRQPGHPRGVCRAGRAAGHGAAAPRGPLRAGPPAAGAGLRGARRLALPRLPHRPLLPRLLPRGGWAAGQRRG